MKKLYNLTRLYKTYTRLTIRKYYLMKSVSRVKNAGQEPGYLSMFYNVLLVLNYILLRRVTKTW